MKRLLGLSCGALLVTMLFASCASVGRSGKSPLDYRDNLVIPKGTVIKQVPFYVNGEGKEPTMLDYTTDSEGVFLSTEGLKAVHGG